MVHLFLCKWAGNIPVASGVLHNWPLQHFIQDYGLVSHTTYVVCSNFIHECHDLKFKVDSQGQIFEKIFWDVYLFSEFWQKSAEKKSPKKYFHIFVLMSDLEFEFRSNLRSKKLTHYLLDYGDLGSC